MGLYISFGYKFKLQSSLNLLSLITGIAVYNCIDNKLADEEIVIKWPNDILVNGKKIAGILIENTITSDSLISVIGIGLNVGHARENFPPDLRDCATSLALESGRQVDIKEITAVLGEYLDMEIERMLRGETEIIIQDYRKKTALLLGSEISFHRSGVKQRAVFRGVDENGAVILEGENRELFNSFSGELFLD